MSDNLKKIKIKKRGNSFGFWFFKMLLHTTGLNGAYGFLYLVCLHYLIFDREAVKAAHAYIEKRFNTDKEIKKYFHIYRLFINQGRQLIDRYAAISGLKKFEMQLKGYNQLVNLTKNDDKGFILLTSHLGNWQIAIESLKKLNKKVYLLMRPEDNPAVSRSLRLNLEKANIQIISVQESIDGVLKIINILKKGGVVCIMGDRHYDFKSIDVSFLGKKAHFPYGAFTIAASLNCPVVPLLSAKLSKYHYKIDTTNILYPQYLGLNKKNEQIRQWVQDYANLLNRYVDEYPYQCFLFHDVWS